MAPGNERGNNQALVAKALRDKQADFAAFVRRRVNHEAAEEILQTAALRAIEHAESLEDPERVVAWLFRLHRNVIIDAARRNATERRVIDRNADLPEGASEAREDPCDCSITQAQGMRGTHASILSLVDISGLDLGEAARVLEISKNTAAVRLHRARKALGERMREHCGVTSAGDCFDCRCVYDGCCAV